MKLPKLKLVVVFLLLFSLLFNNIAVYAQQPAGQQDQPTTTNDRVWRAPGTSAPATSVPATSSGQVSPEGGKVKFWFVAGLIAGTAILGWIFKDDIAKGIDCVTDFHKCVEGAAALTQNFVYKQNVGCDFAMADKNGRFSGTDDASVCHETKMTEVAQGKPPSSPGALNYASAILNSSMELPVPIDSGRYFASIAPFKKTYAQGEGEGAGAELAESDLLLGIWNNVRKASYALLVVILVIVGFMIMFRFPISPRAVVTAQSALPRIAIALLLITFSFSIAGLMADLVRVLTGILLNYLLPGPNFDLGGMIVILIASLFALGGAALAFLGHTFAAIALLFIALIIIAIVLVVFVNLIFKLVTRYVIFILLTVFAPLFFLIGALPGAEGVIFTWFRRAAAALIAIPATAFVLKLSFLIGLWPYLQYARNATGTEFPHLPVPWIVPNPVHTMLEWAALGPIVGLGLYFFATKVPDIVDEMFGNRPLAPRAGIGPGAIIGAPYKAFRAAGDAARSWQSTRTAREGIGRVLRGAGWEPTEKVTEIAGTPINRGGRIGVGRPGPTAIPSEGVWNPEREQEPYDKGVVVERTTPKPGIRAGLARTVVKTAGRLVGERPPPTRTTIVPPEEIAERKRRAEEAKARRVARRESKPGPDELNNL